MTKLKRLMDERSRQRKWQLRLPRFLRFLGMFVPILIGVDWRHSG